MSLPTPFRRRGIGVALAGALIAAEACGGEGPAGPGALSAVIDAPAQDTLACVGRVTVHYSGKSSRGPIGAYAWFDGDAKLGDGPELDREFDRSADYETRLVVRGWGESDETTHRVRIVPAVGCPAAAIGGPNTVLVRSGTDPSVVYSASPSTGGIDAYTWKRNGEVIASGADAESAAVPFAESDLGSNDLGRVNLDLIVEGRGVTDSTRLHVAVLLDGECPYAARGDSLVFFSYSRDPAHPDTFGMYLMNYLDGGVRGPIFIDRNMGSEAALEPCGDRIAFNLNNDIAVIRRDGTGLQVISGDPSIEEDPSWGPTGWLAFVGGLRGYNEPYLIRPDGALRFAVAGTGEVTDFDFRGYNPSWNEDGTRIVQGNVPVDSLTNSLTIYDNLWNGDFGELLLTPLHSKAQLDAYGSTIVSESEPAWYGNRIAYLLQLDDGAWIYTTRADGSDIRRITEGGTPSWSPDGQYIIFLRYVGGLGHIFRVPADGGGVVDLTARTNPDADDAGPALIR